MPKAKPVSLWPLSFEEAITAIIRVKPEKTEVKKSQQQGKKKSKKVEKS